jgi:cell division protein ZapA (FtsZ GTPase activity inhibitor)
MTQKKAVEVIIAGQRLTLRTDQDPQQVQKLADLVNARLAEILPSGQPVSHQVLILLAMNLADDLVKLQEGDTKFRSDVKERSQAILSQLEREFPL